MKKRKTKKRRKFRDTGNWGDSLSIKENMEEIEKFFKYRENLDKICPMEKPIDIVFAISLKSKKVSHNWAIVERNLSTTLKTLLSNTDQNFRVIIAGHEKPEIEELQHKNVEWIAVDFPAPENPNDYENDKMRKRYSIGRYLSDAGYSGYFMPLDGDDWVHYRLVEYLRSLPYHDAFILDKGLMVNHFRKTMWSRYRFHYGCGSSSIFYFANEDFPKTPNLDLSNNVPFHIVLKYHPKLTVYLEEDNKSFQMINLPFVTWVLAHGDNQSMDQGWKSKKISAKKYGANEEPLENWLFEYFKIN
ncbi:hypothetical protein [Neobacillus sp. DY30]|uniref:hypothetical protein n=1 Tax=Neobacillus sp. DY30 TaxID=3047871 RepID=UPI0024BFC849|nr:hypothetical protein [Neobacillus sp. DY30]WHX98464.1 hypothetical protein QNH29_17600 [Neobacillus sp. DY30]